MRVFCPEHKRGFFAPRQSPIKCENRGHVLGELDFTGEAKSSFQLQWQYCCNCEHFSLIEFDEHGLQRCPVCTRRSSILYLCDRCYTISFESNTPLQTKNFTLTSEGVPQPCCPGCLQSPSADLREHNCDDLGAAIGTALNVCPLCGERLDIGPTFPSLVPAYLRKTKSANKLIVTFDYETGLFVPVDDGEFVLVTNSDENGQAVVLPRSPRLATRQDFYELYQDYYHCAAPDTGEINISEPAVVVPVQEGWKLLTLGVLEVVSKHPDKKMPVNSMPQRASQALNQEVRKPNVPDVKVGELVAPCTQCGALIESKYAYCWECGSPREPKNEASMMRPKLPRLILSTVESEDDEEHTVQHEPRSARSQLFSWASTEKPERPVKPRGSVLKLFTVAAGALLILLFALFMLTRSNSNPVTSAQAVAPAGTTNATPVAGSPNLETQLVSQSVPATLTTEDELENLRRMRAVANESDRSKILQTFSKTEKKYSADYRIPYERAKLVVLDHEKNFHEEAFAALARAAQKAINSGKAGEMLQSLKKDSDGDFHKLSHGHREWTQLQKALKSKDVSVLQGNEGL